MGMCSLNFLREETRLLGYLIDEMEIERMLRRMLQGR